MKKLFSVFTLICLVFTVGCTDESNYYIVDECTVEKLDDGQELTCGGASVHIPDQLPVLSVVDPCGDGPGVDEVLIVLQDGLYLAWYKKVGLSVLLDGVTYITTDYQRCKFKIVDGVVLEL